MAQNTNSTALNRLRPLENTNVGSIVQEHIRYWQKYKDDKDAKKLAQDLREQEFKRKISKENADAVEGIKLEDSSSYFRGQIVSNFEEQKPELVELKLKANNGDTQAALKLSQKIEEFRTLTNLDKITGEALTGLLESENDFNEALDGDKKSFAKNIINSKYRIRGNKAFVVNENGDGVDEFNVQGLINKIQSLGKYSGKFNPTEYGTEIASTIELDSSNGNQNITDQTRIEAIRKAQNSFINDPVSLKSWAFSKGYPKSRLNNLQESDLISLSKQFAEEEILPELQEKDNSLSNQAKRISIAKSALDLKKSKEEQNEDKSTIALSTDSEGNKTILSQLEKEGEILATEKATVFNLQGKSITTGVKGKSGSNKTFTSLAKTEKGDIIAIGQEVIKKDVPVLNELGEVQFTTKEGDVIKTRTEEQVVDIVEKDEKVLNNIAGQIKNEKGKNLKNLKELNQLMDNAEGLSKEGQELVNEGEKSIQNSAQIKDDVAKSAKDIREGISQANEAVKAAKAFQEANNRGAIR